MELRRFKTGPYAKGSELPAEHSELRADVRARLGSPVLHGQTERPEVRLLPGGLYRHSLYTETEAYSHVEFDIKIDKQFEKITYIYVVNVFSRNVCVFCGLKHLC